MTKGETEAVLDRVRTRPEDRQAYAAFVQLELERESQGIYALSEEERADVGEGLAGADRGEFATDEEVQALSDQYRG